MLEDSIVLQEGYAQKQSSGLVKKFQSRYFVLSGHYLRYYENKDSNDRNEQPKGVVDLNDVRTVAVADDDLITIVMKESERQILIKASSANSAVVWRDALAQVMAALMENASQDRDVGSSATSKDF